MAASELVPIALSLAAAACWGAGDFIGGITAKKTDVLGVVVFALATGAMVAGTLALLQREALPTLTSAGWAAGAGVCGSLALSAFYHSLAIGKIGINAPVSGVLTAAIPAVAGIVMLGPPGTIRVIGFVLAILSIVLVSQGGTAQGGTKGVGLALAAGVGFGCFLLFLKLATGSGIFAPLAVSRAFSATFILVICLLLRRSWFPQKGTALAIASAGVLDTVGTLLYAYAAQIGRMDVAAVLASLYPAVPVILARVLLKEHLSRLQISGVVAALLAIVLIAR